MSSWMVSLVRGGKHKIYLPEDLFSLDQVVAENKNKTKQNKKKLKWATSWQNQ